MTAAAIDTTDRTPSRFHPDETATEHLRNCRQLVSALITRALAGGASAFSVGIDDLEILKGIAERLEAANAHVDDDAKAVTVARGFLKDSEAERRALADELRETRELYEGVEFVDTHLHVNFDAKGSEDIAYTVVRRFRKVYGRFVTRDWTPACELMRELHAVDRARLSLSNSTGTANAR